MGAGGSIPTSREDALAAGYTEEQIAKFEKKGNDIAQMLFAYLREKNIKEALDIIHHPPNGVSANLRFQHPAMGGTTCLHWACGTGQSRIAAELIEAGAPLDLVDADGDTPMHAAVGLSCAGTDAVWIVETMMAHGGAAIKNIKNKAGDSPLSMAESAGENKAETHGKVLELLKGGDAGGGGSEESPKESSGEADATTSPELALALCESCGKLDVEALKRLLAQGVSPNTRSGEQSAAGPDFFPLAIASAYVTIDSADTMAAQEAVLRTLVEAGADLQQLFEGKFTALSLTAQKNKTYGARALIKLGADVEYTRHPNNVRPLHFACMAGSVGVAQALLEAGADKNALKADGLSPLYLAISHVGTSAHAEIAGRLLDAGADPNLTKHAQGATPLQAACSIRITGLVKDLIKAGATVNVDDESACDSPLFIAVAVGSSEIVAVLLAAGAAVADEASFEKKLPSQRKEHPSVAAALKLALGGAAGGEEQNE